MRNILRIFSLTVVLVLLLTAGAKLWGSFGSATILKLSDPIFGLSFRTMVWRAGLAELVVAGVCVLAKQAQTNFLAVSWLGTCLLLYRLGLVFVHYRRPCHCLGGLTDAIHVSPE